MPNLRQISLNANNGAFVDVLATINVAKLEIMEDEAGATQGVQIKSMLDNFVTTNVLSFGSEPALIPHPSHYPLKGRLLGMPAQGTTGAFNAIAATKLVSLRSNGGAATTVRVIEYE